ncbi:MULTISPECIES: SDR family oxidoreductase [unclassified Halorhodospira]|uniref:SDR family oxidoreductase n=1 Tax=unclassified Halorhodospira TaxID=2626748 RepID=UPI001EE94B12|nr:MULTISPECIES: SDR family oxidoreductase [unclassified Halorhodospira]MCG5541415.1 SDR family oxidoreductase [Halorhodospira sp. M39old]MCG5546409.1 SDR family oxidoreductase [Halorhodospira sp. M38]
MAEEPSDLGGPRGRILIAGCGRIGQALGSRLAAGGAEVFGLRRRPEGLPEGITPIAADLEDPATLAEALPTELDTVYYIVTPGSYDDDGYRRAFVDGLDNLAGVLRRHPAPPRRLVFVSSTAVYGQQDGEWIDEDSPTEPGRFSGQRLLEAEAIALAGPWTGVAARYGGIYGSGRDFLIRKVEAGEPCQEGQYTNRIHSEDVVGSLAHLGRDDIPGGVYLGVDDAPSTQCEVMDGIAELLGVPRPPRGEPGSGGMRGVGSKRGSNRKLKASGYRLRYPTFREGYAALIGGGV